MELEVIFAIILGITSFLSGFTTMLIFCHKKKQKSNNDVSARLPSLISVEIMLLLWYLMACTPLMLYLWFHLGEYNVAGSTLFVISFVPIYTTHIIRIWLLKIKYNVASLSMLNQLGMVKWKEIRGQIFMKIYYKHKWSHNISTLIKISILFNLTITIIYLSLALVNTHYALYLNVIIFTILTLCLIIGIFSIKSFNDPFNIFREEIIVLCIWFIALIMYCIFHIFLWNQFLSHNAWTITVTFFGVVAAVLSIVIHFHFNRKSIEAVQKRLPSLGIIVSTKEGLEKFLRFLVTELSVENLEFFTLSMRWRHRLVLRDKRRARKRASKKLSKFPFDTTDQLNVAKTKQIPNTANTPDTNSANSANTPTFTCTPKQETPIGNFNVKRSSKLQQITEFVTSFSSQTNINIPNSKLTPHHKATNTSHDIQLLTIQKQNPAPEADTHLQQLPFPILTFEFLDRDVIKKGEQKQAENNNTPTLKRDNTMSTSYVLEFSKTKSSLMPQLAKKRTATETVVSVFFEQYDVMQINKRRMTEMSSKGTITRTNTNTNTNTNTQSRTIRTKTIPTLQPNFYTDTTESHIKTITSTGTPHTTRTLTGVSVTKKKSLNSAARLTPAQSPVHNVDDSLTLKNIDLGTTNKTPTTDTPLMRPASSDVPARKSIGNDPITPYMGGAVHNIDTSNEFALDQTNNMSELKEDKELNKLPKHKNITVAIHNVEKINKDKKQSNTSGSKTSTPIGTIVEEEETTNYSKATHVMQDSDHKQIQYTLQPMQTPITPMPNTPTNNVFCIVDRLSVFRRSDMDNDEKEKENNIQIINATHNTENKSDTKSNTCVQSDVNNNNNNKETNKERNGVTFGGWFDENEFEMYDEEWTEEFMSSKRVSYDRFVVLSEEVNISAIARNALRDFFTQFDTVKKFKDVNIANYDSTFEIAWRDVWQNLNDSLRRFHQSKFYREWLTSNAANGLNVIPMHDKK